MSKPNKTPRFKFGKHGLYYYRPRYTLSFCWDLPWHWLPFVSPADGDGSWDIGWGWWVVEKRCWGPYDDYGEQAGEIQAGILEWLCEDIAKEP